MSRFLRNFTLFTGITLAVIIVIVSITWMRLPNTISNELSDKMKVKVHIDDIDLSTKAISVKKLEIGNPKGSTLKKAFSVDLIKVMTPITRYLKKDIVIEEITLDNIYLGLEFDSIKSTKGNWTTIMKNLKSSLPEKKKDASEKSDRSLLIKKLVLTNTNVDLLYRDKGTTRKLRAIKRMEFTNISSEGGVPISQLMNSVLGQMLQSIFVKENLKSMLDGIVPDSPVDKILQPLKGLFYAPPAAEKETEAA